jgi:hypothetical protein
VIVSSDKVGPEKIDNLTSPFIVVGLLLAGLTSLSVLAAVVANVQNRRKLRKYDNDLSLGVWAPTTITAWIVACAIPLAFAVGWVLIWIN